MKANLKLIKKRRTYSEEFKKLIVKEFESGKFSVLDLCRLHQIKKSVIYRWIYKYSPLNDQGQRIVEMTKSSTQKLKELEKKIKDLEITSREYQVLQCISEGLSNKEIGEKLFLSESTIKTHVSNLLLKLNAKRRTQAIQIAKTYKII